MSNTTWHNVSKNEKCPVCGHDSWCSVSDVGAWCYCHRTPSDKPAKSGSGWIHRLSGEQSPKAVTNSKTFRNSIISPASYFAALPKGEIQVRLCRELMRELSLPCDMLLVHDVRWDSKAKAAAFPMRDADGNVTGIRYRQLKTGRKWALTGSKDGLFYIRGFIPITDEIVVCEGPTDMLAACSCGLYAVGRSCCTSGAALLKAFIRKHRVKRVTIAADDDKPKQRPDGSTWRPGFDGAVRLADELGIPARIVFPFPGFKDLREWYARGGMTDKAFNIATAGASWRGGIDPKELLP